MSAVNVRITNDLKNPKEVGVHHRFICMTGPNKGKVYYLTGKRIMIGRGENVDVQILDTKISKEHAELSLVDKNYIITDLSNQNGVMINDLKIKQKQLLDNEKIVIGQTVIKYNLIEIKEEKNEIVAVEDNVIELPNKDNKKTNAKPKMDFKAQAANESFEEPKPAAKAQGSKTIVLVIFLAALGFIFFGGDDNQNSSVDKTKKNDESGFNIESEAAAAKQGKLSKEDPEVRRKFEMLIHSGRREFREGNYFRAMEEFRRADLLIPGSGLAGYLMSRAKQRLDEDVTRNFDQANKNVDSKKYQAAIVSYCGVVQLLQKYPEDERYKNAMDKIHSLETEMGLEKGEIKCFEEKPADPKN